MSSLEAKLARYEQLIPHLHQIQTALWRRVDEKMMRAACRVMATHTKCDFLPRDEDSIAMMLNYCCFNIFFPGGRTLVDVYSAEHPAADADQRAVLEAHQKSYFSLFELLELVPGIGARLRDVFNDESLLVVYPRLVEMMRPGLILPVRVMPLEDFHVFFNGPIPFNKIECVQQYEASIFQAYGKHGVEKGRPLTVEQRANIETFQTIRVLALRYPELVPSPARPSTPAPSTPAERVGAGLRNGSRQVGRNDPCPCGSGKKFKQCCLGRN